jgi:hypothetical protein
MADKAVVNFPRGGMNTKSKGDTPCSGNYAEPKLEPIAINHAGNPPWPMENVGCMEAEAQVPNRKRGKGE